MKGDPSLRQSLAWKLRYKWPSELRCVLGIHTLKAYRARLTSEQETAEPMHPRSRPGPGDHRVCTWCGARWDGAYDGIEPHWRRTTDSRRRNAEAAQTTKRKDQT